MKCIIAVLVISLFVSCGKKAKNDSDNVVTSTPPVSVDEDEENIIENESYSIRSDKNDYLAGQAVLVTIKNTGETPLDHQSFHFSTEPSAAVVTNLNCFIALAANGECTYSVMFQNPKSKTHKIVVRYYKDPTDINLELYVGVTADDNDPVLEFLYRKDHTFDDCKATFKHGAFGVVKSLQANDLCSLRGKHWAAAKQVEIEVDPMQEYHDPRIDANTFYCKENWTLHSFQFEAAKVKEVKNIFGGKRVVTIPAGESREVCVKRKLFGCKTTKVFYSRLVGVHCY